jgi:16S rRNA (cytosine1402-N4)-methyltransferase
MHQNQEHQQYHIPVLAEETIDMLNKMTQGILVDATFGGGGHTARLIEATPTSVQILAFDRDSDAAANLAPEWDRVDFVQRSFGEIEDILDEKSIKEISGALFDLGVSSHQLDEAERGFSYQCSGPLDMRMGPDAPFSAEEIVNEWSEAELSQTIHMYGEERFAKRIAQTIVQARPLTDTAMLVDIVKSAIPAATRRTGGHPARRTFQAIRIAANDELGELERGLDGALARLTPGGRCVVISYHSLEDRYVKRRFAASALGCDCPPDLPVCACGKTPEFEILTRKPIVPSDAEIERNPRSRSAKMRVIKKVAA